MKLDVRYGIHPFDFKFYLTKELRDEFLIKNIFEKDEINLTYSHNDRIIIGGIMPVREELKLESSKELASDYFLELREMGIINIGGKGLVYVDGREYELDTFDSLYIGKGNKNISFVSVDEDNASKFYINSCPAHKEYETCFIPINKAKKLKLGDNKKLNKRTIYQIIHPDVCNSCQLVMGLTILEEANVWNTMPCHTHERRMEVYFYFGFSENDFVMHFMGEKNETRHLVIKDEEAVISPSFSIHCGAGTTNYSFIWGMCGENKKFDDMDFIENKDLM